MVEGLEEECACTIDDGRNGDVLDEYVDAAGGALGPDMIDRVGEALDRVC